MGSLLSIVWNVDPVLFSIGPLGIRWYSLLFVGGFIVGYYILRGIFRREDIPVDKFLDPLLYTLLAATIVGARLGHCLFYQPTYYLAPFVALFGGTPDPVIARLGMSNWQAFWEIFQPWKGGLASHGGAIAILLAMWWFAGRYGKRYNVSLLWILDRVVIVICFAGAMIRLGNLFNSEIYGDVTTLPWGVIFQRSGETLPKHPTQLYEALGYLLLGTGLWLNWRYRLEKIYRGEIFGLFLVGLFGLRFLIEFIKEPQEGTDQVLAAASASLNMGQLLSLPFILAGVGVLIWAMVKKLPGKRMAEDKPRKKTETHFAHGV